MVLMAENQNILEKLREIDKNKRWEYGQMTATGIYMKDESKDVYKEVKINELIEKWNNFLKENGIEKYFISIGTNNIQIWVLYHGEKENVMEIVYEGVIYNMYPIEIFHVIDDSDPEVKIYLPPEEQEQRA